MRDAGLDERAITDALGQRTIEMTRHYAKGADLTAKMRGVAATLEREVNKPSTKVSNFPEKVSNFAGKAARDKRIRAGQNQKAAKQDVAELAGSNNVAPDHRT